MADQPENTSLGYGMKRLAFALPLYFIGPSVIYNAFQNQHTAWHYLVLAVGILMCLGAIYLSFRGIFLIVRNLFNRDPDEHSGPRNII